MKKSPQRRKLAADIVRMVYYIFTYLLIKSFSDNLLIAMLIGALMCAVFLFASALIQAFLLKDAEALAVFKGEHPLVNCLTILLGALITGFLMGLLVWFFGFPV